MVSTLNHTKQIVSAQLPDRILWKKEWLDLFTNPLEQYWTVTGKRRPPFCLRYNCTRGYVAKWNIRNNQLYLLSLEGFLFRRNIFFQKKKVACNLQTVFRKRASYPIRAEWFSGKLRIPQGNMIAYDHENYNSRFEKEILLTIEKGNLIKSVTINNKERTVSINYESQ